MKEKQMAEVPYKRHAAVFALFFWAGCILGLEKGFPLVRQSWPYVCSIDYVHIEPHNSWEALKEDSWTLYWLNTLGGFKEGTH